MSVISLPDRRKNIREAVQSMWPFLSEAEDAQEIKYERKKANVRDALEGFTDEEVFAK